MSANKKKKNLRQRVSAELPEQDLTLDETRIRTQRKNSQVQDNNKQFWKKTSMYFRYFYWCQKILNIVRCLREEFWIWVLTKIWAFFPKKPSPDSNKIISAISFCRHIRLRYKIKMQISHHILISKCFNMSYKRMMFRFSFFYKLSNPNSIGLKYLRIFFMGGGEGSSLCFDLLNGQKIFHFFLLKL